MAFYTTLKHHSLIGYWEELKEAKTLTDAKKLAYEIHGSGFSGHIIHIVECEPSHFESGQINDFPSHTKVVGHARSAWRYND